MSSQPDSHADVRSALQLGIQAAGAYGRPDLAERLEINLNKLGDPNVQVVVIGEFKQGKSSLINALVNAKICPVDDDIATAVPTVLSYGEEKAAIALVTPLEKPDAEPDRRSISFEQVPAYATELGMADPNVAVKGVEIKLPRKLLQNGLVLVDTPGVGGLGSAHATAALGALSVADAALFVSDASQEFTRAEMDFLTQARDLCPHVVCIMTKVDFYPAWRRVLEINQGHLARAGIKMPIMPVSSTLRAEAVRRNDRDLNKDSGFPNLVKFLTNQIVAEQAARERMRCRQDLLSVCDQLGSQFEAELSALTDPEQAAQLMERLTAAKSRAERLKGQAAKWSTTLNDGVGDLTSDVDFDFRQRMRLITQEADAAIANSDPLDTWSEFEPWLVNRVSNEVVTNYRFLTERAAHLGLEVGNHFEADGDQLMDDLDIHNPTGVLARVSVDPTMEMEGTSKGAQGMTVLRGSYSGILMFGMLGSMVGLSLGAIPIGIGLMMGRKSLKDEKARQANQRRAQAKNSLRRYCDEVSFQVSKDSRDTLRRVQRQLRDHYSTRAEEMHVSTTTALQAAAQAVKVGEGERARRVKDIRAELSRIQGMRAKTEAIAATPAGATA